MRLYAVSDIHIGYRENRVLLETLVADLGDAHHDDWLLVVGDVAERVEHVGWALGLLRRSFGTVVWVPGNHELWTMPKDPVAVRGDDRYQLLVEMCHALDVVTPEDPYRVFDGPDGPLTVVPLFLLYDYTFRPRGMTRDEALQRAYDAKVVCTDERFLYPDPYPTRDAWCQARIAATLPRLEALGPDERTLLVSHYPLRREPTDVLRYPEFAIWCGTTATADWHTRFRADAVIYGHLHIPRTTSYDGVPFHEVSLGYPREWQPRPNQPPLLRPIY